MNRTRPVSGYSAVQLVDRLARARGQLHALIERLPADAWLGPRAEHLNPPLWEYGHIVWFQERWCLRAQADGACAPGLLQGVDALYDSSAVPHDSRWTLPLLTRDAVDDYAARVAQAVAAQLHDAFDAERAYFAELSLYHELMHIEAWWMAFQNLGYAAPAADRATAEPEPPGRLAFADGVVELGSGDDAGFIFDNEKWRHPVALPAYDIDTQPVSETAFAAFVDADGYRRRSGWSAAGWAWRQAANADHPLYWRKRDGHWQVRRFAHWTPLDPAAPMLHVNLYEAEAYAAWVGRRLPAATQWLQATTQPAFRWGRCWEWLREPFAPYPGFSPDPYRDYSQPWFHTHQELRGGGPCTDPQLRRPAYRNFYQPHRRDPFAGFRTVSPAESARA